jgi:M6 family metalloprotease-like protein
MRYNPVIFIFLIFLIGSAAVLLSGCVGTVDDTKNKNESINQTDKINLSQQEPETYPWPYKPANPVIGERKLLVILWDPHRPDHPAPNATVIEKLIFGPPPSASDYFSENSRGKFKLNLVAVLGWYDADKPASHYWAPADTNDSNNDGWIHGHVEKWAEAIRKADREINFSLYDQNKNGVISSDELGILIVIPQNNSFGTYRQLKGREYPVGEPLVVDGVSLPVVAEAYIGKPPDLGVTTHEISHLFLDAPDMYFTFFYPYAAGEYSLMDVAKNNHMDPYNKLRLGWIEPKVVLKSGEYKLCDIESTGDVILLYDKNHSTKEYFLLENRQHGTYYDSKLPDTGLAIWHIIEEENVYSKLPAPSGVDAGKWTGVSAYDWGRRAIRMLRPAYGPPFDNTKALWDDSDLVTAGSITLKWVDGKESGFIIKNLSSSSKEMKVWIEVKGSS